jgi:hypothetical protein
MGSRIGEKVEMKKFVLALALIGVGLLVFGFLYILLSESSMGLWLD